MKTSKVKAIADVKEWTSGNGSTIYYQNIELENSDKINIGKKSKLSIGDEVNYKIVGDLGQHEYTKAKAVQLEQGNFNKGGSSFKADPKKQTIIVAQSSMTKAVDILLSGVVPMEFKSVSDFVDKAEALTDLLMKKQIELTEKHYKSF